MRRTLDLALVLLVLAGLVAVACSDSDDDRSSIEPVATTIPAGAGDVRFPDDQIVWQVRTYGGLVPQVSWAAQRPSLTIYGDGRFYVSAPGLDRRFDQPIALRTGTVDREALAIFLAGVEASGLFDADDELGQPSVTDMATTSVLVHGVGEPALLTAYALGGRFDADLPDETVRERETLRRLLSGAEALVPDPEAWDPDRVRVLRLPDDATFERKPDADPDAEPLPWPGPDPAGFDLPAPEEIGSTEVLGCHEVTGTAASDLFEAATTNPLPRWEVDGAVQTLVVVALLPGEAACGVA